jgi:hypothetical protein
LVDSRWGSLIVRAATRGCLDTFDGCPPTKQYVLREATIVGEMLRQEMADRNYRLMTFYIESGMRSAEIMLRLDKVSTRDALDTFEEGIDKALLSFQLGCHVLDPWDDSWKTVIEKTRARLRDRSGKIEGADISSNELVKMIRDFERVRRVREKQRQKAKQADESVRVPKS